MGKSRIDPRKYGMSRAQVKGSWWFVVKCPDGSVSMCHYSPATCIADVIRKNGGDPSLHAAKYGSKTLDNDRCLEEYRINLNGSAILGDHAWDGKLAVLTVGSKGVISAVRGKFSKKAGAGAGGTSYDLVLLGATGLVAADKSGTSDPYVVFSFAGQEGGRARSSTIKKTLDPVWKGKEEGQGGEAVSVQGPARDEAVLRVQVFDANVIQKDVLLGEAEVDLGRLWKEVQYYTHSMRAVQVPLAPQGWVSFAWKTADQQLINRDGLIWEPGCGFASVELAQERPDEWAPEEKVAVLSYHSSLRGVVRFLEARLYEAKRAETPGPSVLKIAAEFGEGDSWSELSARWTPELLAPVTVFALEVKAGHSPEEVGALLAAVKAAPSVTEVHLLDFDSSDAMEHGIQALKGAAHITRLKYSDDQEAVNDDGATSVAELVTELPALTSLELVPGNGMLESQHLPKLLGAMAGLKLKSLTLSELPPDSQKVDLSALVKTAAAESLAIRFKYGYFDETLIWTSVVDSLKESPVRRLAVEHQWLASDAAKQLVAAVLEMPSVEEFRATVRGEGFNDTLPLLSSPKLKGLSLKVHCKTDGDSFMQAAATNHALERLQLEGDLVINQAALGKLAEENSTLKVLLLDIGYSHLLSYCDPTVLKQFAANTTLTTTALCFWKVYDSAFRDRVAEVAKAWAARGATFSH